MCRTHGVEQSVQRYMSPARRAPLRHRDDPCARTRRRAVPLHQCAGSSGAEVVVAGSASAGRARCVHGCVSAIASAIEQGAVNAPHGRARRSLPPLRGCDVGASSALRLSKVPFELKLQRLDPLILVLPLTRQLCVVDCVHRTVIPIPFESVRAIAEVNGQRIHERSLCVCGWGQRAD